MLAICPWSCVLVVVNPLPHTLCRFKSHSDADGNVSHVLSDIEECFVLGGSYTKPAYDDTPYLFFVQTRAKERGNVRSIGRYSYAFLSVFIMCHLLFIQPPAALFYPKKPKSPARYISCLKQYNNEGKV